MSDHVSTVITAAGDSRQLFLGAGFDRPKSLLERAGSTVLTTAVECYAYDLGRTHVALNDEECTEWDIDTHLLSVFPEVSVTRVRAGVQGALVSALCAMGAVQDDDALIIAAGDSEIRGGIRGIIDELMATGAAAGTVVFPSANPRWSYILPGERTNVRQVAEKQVIGPLATTGVFFFRSAQLFMKAAEWCLVNNARTNGVFYVSTALNFLIAENLPVTFHAINRQAYKSWSLPADFVRQSD